MSIIITTFLLLALNFNTDMKSIHDYKIQQLNSKEVIDFSDFKGKKILIVNVASRCGYTPQYQQLEELCENYKNELVIVGFPCDQFGGQELDSEDAIEEFCTSKFSVSFPMTTIIDVKGERQHPIYTFLTSKSLNGKDDYKIKWNFNKFLLDENGNVLEYFPSSVTPLDDKILKYLD